MLKHFLISILFFCIGHTCYSQDYSLYYKYIDSIHYYQQQNNPTKALALYKTCFNQFKGFYEDYENAICYSYTNRNKIDDSLYIQAFEAGSSFFMLYMDVHKFVPFPFFKTYRLYRKHKTKKSNSIFPILRMIYKDQKYRKGGFKGKNIDSLNAQKLIYWAKNEPERFNRFKSGIAAQNLLGVIIFHDGWRYLQPIQKELMEFTRKGWLNRDAMAYLVERDGVMGQNYFKIQGDSLTAIHDTTHFYCDGKQLPYSNIDYFFMGVDKQENIRYFTPTNPIISSLEMEELRRFLLLPSTDLLYLINPHYKRVTLDEYCEYRKKYYQNLKKQTK
jgi:hypothetical protein